MKVNKDTIIYWIMLFFSIFMLSICSVFVVDIIRKILLNLIWILNIINCIYHIKSWSDFDDLMDNMKR